MTQSKFVICKRNTGYEASLELRKLYLRLPDNTAKSHGQIRVVDESGEDYLYPTSFFIPIDLPASVAKQVAHTA
ncbi:MAG: hypothetical protein OES53_04935 [Xanthomonadales bacterium]|jgi:hypothetical protein|nr:hypothetical protein [Xanthomonadales bacterium]MDH3923867.1 hypothetical protein [Xanthomonadales bacterium]MDH4002496.1 hypothetical protein [Xanthomonadales bacterium]